MALCQPAARAEAGVHVRNETGWGGHFANPSRLLPSVERPPLASVRASDWLVRAATVRERRRHGADKYPVSRITQLSGVKGPAIGSSRIRQGRIHTYDEAGSP